MDVIDLTAELMRLSSPLEQQSSERSPQRDRNSTRLQGKYSQLERIQGLMSP
jgi:hypothetical protein